METLKIKINTSILNNINSVKVGISQKNFMRGTYKITEPGYYILTEDIIFNPQCPFLKYKNSILDEDIDYEEEIDWLPTSEQVDENGEYKHSSFILGFYSAINIETDNVILDLNGFSIVEHPLHSLQQRFFQTIQLNNSPFISKQGPSKTFSDSGFKSTNNIIIKNGYIGRTSHYCIHGNDNTNIILQDLICENFEAGGIALNNVDNLVMENVQIKNSRTDIPVLANYSILRNTKITYNKCKKELLKNVEFRKEKSIDIFKRLLRIERRIINNYIMSEFKHIINSNVDDEIEREIKKYYYNKTGLSDASVLTGCQITPQGVAIHGFENKSEVANPCCHSGSSFSKLQSQYKYSKNIYIYNSSIKNLIAKPVEVVTCKHDGKILNGVFGDTINLLNIMNRDTKYRSTTLNDCICCLSNIKKSDKNIVTTINIPEWMSEWSESGKKISDFKHKIEIAYGLDVMAHVMKGCLGLRIGGTTNITLQNLRIKNIHNIGNESLYENTFEDKNKTISITGVQEETGNKYAGTLSTGIIFSNCSNILGYNLKIEDIESKHRNQYNIIYNDSEKIKYL